MPGVNDPNLLVGPEHHSDAGAYRIGESLALLQTVDFFPPLCDEPALFGAIAAANSLSDVYAMGGRPITALNIVAFPHDELPLEVLSEILRGGAEKAREAGAAILGGHSVRDKEIKYGMAVTGLVDPARMATNAGARPGDVLLLTKPIGTGAMTAAFRKDAIDAAIWAACLAQMAALNRAASEAMTAAGARAATDITGFGLLGHASEMAEASGATLEIESAAVPLIPGALELSAAGFATGAARTNDDYVKPRLEVARAAPPEIYRLLIDAQTSGGLLIALAEERLPAFAAEMQARGAAWWRIGSARAASGAALRLV